MIWFEEKKKFFSLFQRIHIFIITISIRNAQYYSENHSMSMWYVNEFEEVNAFLPRSMWRIQLIHNRKANILVKSNLKHWNKNPIQWNATFSNLTQSNYSSTNCWGTWNRFVTSYQMRDRNDTKNNDWHVRLIKNSFHNSILNYEKKNYIRYR